MSITQTDLDANIRFMDNGIGLPNEHRIFEFGASYSNGQGLGLFLTRQIIEAHKGTIDAVANNDDRVYNGALFKIRIPKNQKQEIFYPTIF